MKNLLLILLLANILYFLWGLVTEEEQPAGVAIIDESDLGPPLAVTASTEPDAIASVGAVLGSGEPSALEAVVGRSCVTIGPFTASADADSARGEYAADGMSTRLRTDRGEIPIGNWVQIRNVPDRATGNAMVEQLHNGGLGDAYLVETDDEGLKIALGLFGDAENAERVELQARSLGFEPDISLRTREGSLFYVDIALPPGRGAGAIVDRFGEDIVALRDEATCPD